MKTMRPTFGAFNQGELPKIACFNKATVALGVNFDALIAAMQVFVDKHVAPVWGTPAKLIKSKGFVKGAWAMVFLDDADQPGALAYHDLTPDGLPEDMGLPGLGLHPLKVDRKGAWAVKVSGNWRMTFTFVGKDADHVDYEDYH